MNAFHRFELPYKSLNFSPSCPDYPWFTQERELVYGPGLWLGGPLGAEGRLQIEQGEVWVYVTISLSAFKITEIN